MSLNTIDSGLNSAMPPMASLVLNSPDAILKSLGGEYVTKTITLAGGAGVKTYDCFTFTGVVEIWGLYGVVMTVTDMTQARAASFQWGVAGASIADITESAVGVDCTGAVVGSLIAKRLVAASAADFVDAAAGGVVESARDATLKCFTLVARSGATNTIQFVVNQNAATSATIKMVAFWRPLSSTCSVVAS